MISVVESNAARYLQFNDQQVQGGSYLDPDASIVDPDLAGQPGPVAACSYMNGWLAAGAHNPTGSFVMVGLGSGAGAIALLYNFPSIDLTVVEIDQGVVDTAIKFFPLLKYYQDQGKLNIVVESAQSYLPKNDKWDTCLCDAYVGENALVEAVIVPALKSADQIWFNAIGRPQSLNELLRIAYKFEHPIGTAYLASLINPDAAEFVDSNWILTDQIQDCYKLDSFEAYKGIRGRWPGMERRNYERLVGRNHIDKFCQPTQ